MGHGLLHHHALHLQALRDAARVLVDRGIQRHLALLVARRQHGGDDGLHHLADHAGEAGVLPHHVDRGGDGAAALVAEHDHERAAQHADAVLDAAHGRRVHGVAGVAHDEDLAQPAVEQQFRRHAAVGAADQDAERRLAMRQLQPPLAAQQAAMGQAGDEIVVALLHRLQRLVGGEAGLGHCLRRHGTPGGCGHGQRRQRAETGEHGPAAGLEVAARFAAGAGWRHVWPLQNFSDGPETGGKAPARIRPAPG
ncbi:Hypothetical protein RMHFA_05673 [Roseomonas mucosa]|nr:Hypothetical protein RMHFA_05673 [Roseomonas mucosa]